MLKYMVTGWSKRLGHWREEYIEAKNKKAAIVRYKASNPTTQKVKAYALGGVVGESNPYVFNPKQAQLAFVAPRSLAAAARCSINVKEN